MKWLRIILLFPFTILHTFIVVYLNFLYNLGVLKSRKFDIPVIAIGNLSTGGTGKTPMAEYLVRLLTKQHYHPAYLSRGYKRKSRGFVLANPEIHPAELGDEAYEVYEKLNIPVAVCESRAEGIDKLLATNHLDIDIIILDDAYQHRRVKPGLTILLTEFHNPYFKDFVFPSGNLREPRFGKNRADIICTTKCPDDIKDIQKSYFTDKIKPDSHQLLSFCSLQYDNPVDATTGTVREWQEFEHYSGLLFSGIANPLPLSNFLQQKISLESSINFPDHHNFSKKNIDRIIRQFENIKKENKCILTTAKDISRLKGSGLLNSFDSLPLYFIPVNFVFLGNDHFNQRILDYVKQNQRNS